ncbi:hypothetical protein METBISCDRAFT_21929 [Metschnikowia bicuspidata]|uniref:EamA domain-containing protein n=1 Tax=Metschnikowia bicuspidata TaxID=27322 RepID=A0A4P9ZGG3_9ASCO|nr:hypothetical protein METBISCDRAFT_21929 [Metschnikowia bicuspidata]
MKNYGSSPDESLVAAADASADSMELNDDEVGLWETVDLSLKFFVLWFLTNLATNASLSFTSVASQTILSSTSFFILLVGAFYIIEINMKKVLGIFLSFCGVIIVSKIDFAEESALNGNSYLSV